MGSSPARCLILLFPTTFTLLTFYSYSFYHLQPYSLLQSHLSIITHSLLYILIHSLLYILIHYMEGDNILYHIYTHIRDRDTIYNSYFIGFCYNSIYLTILYCSILDTNLDRYIYIYRYIYKYE